MSMVYMPLSEGTVFLIVSWWVSPSGLTEIWCFSLASRTLFLCSHTASWQGVRRTHLKMASSSSGQLILLSGCSNPTGMAAMENQIL